ncbi:MAG: hypothetical protein PUB68_08415 [Lachnospiraceae bacterium]|nr:hypothetical protein [Lachnospiraceae bacterium]
MINIKGFAIAQDGAMKRIAVTYDQIDSNGKVVNPNARINRVITDSDVLAAVTLLEDYAGKIADEL